MNEQIAANKRKGRLMLAGFALVPFVVLAVINVFAGANLIGFVVAIALAAIVTYLAAIYSEKAALRAAHAIPAKEQEYPRYYNLVESLCISSGSPEPKLYVVHDAAPNAFATGLSPRRAALVVTTGLLEKLNRVELEGVLAHELSHIRNYDILVNTLAVLLGRFALNDDREFAADASGVLLTRYPPGLISALKKIEDDGTTVSSTTRSTAHLWLEAPGASLDDRIEVLEQM